MATKYLDSNGLLYFWQKIKAKFLTNVSYDSTSKKIQKTINGNTSDIVTLSTVATSGSYSDLSNKPSTATTSADGFMSSSDKTKIDGIASGAEVNVQSDWNDSDTTSDAYIANKPTIPAKNTWYGTSSTAGSTKVKVVTTLSGDFVLATGNMVRILFDNAQEYETYPELNVDGTGAVYVCPYDGAHLTELWRSGEVVDAVYNGSEFVLSRSGWANTTQYGLTKLSTSVSSASTTVAATSSAVKQAYDLADAKAPTQSPEFTGVPKAPTATAGTNTTQIATTAFVKNAVDTAITGAASFQGTAPTTFAPTDYKAGYYWVVGTAGTYAGQVCEPGDMIFATVDYSSAYAAADFDVVQTNLDITAISNSDIDTIVAA